jgi:peptide/nickel transport system substrate-binding protein
MVALQLPWPAAVPVHCFDRSKPPSLFTMKHAALPLSRRAVNIALSFLLGAAAGFNPVLAATPKDTLVLAFAFDDIITMDPAEAFEISTGEVMGNAYDRLIRFDVKDPSKLYGDVAKSWTVSADGKTFTFEIKPGLKFASGNPLTAEDVAFSLQRAVLLDKTPAFILTQFGLNKSNVRDVVKATGPLHPDIGNRQGLRHHLCAQLPDGQRGQRGGQEAAAVQGTGR